MYVSRTIILAPVLLYLLLNRPILRKVGFYGESEQWLAELYPSYAKTDPRRYWKQLQSLFAKGNYTEQIRSAFNKGALRYSIKHRKTIKTISPATMALDIEKSTSDALKKASERPRPNR